ncbi:MAG: hypothetical protein ACTTJ1_02005 [Treponema sp.]
MKSTNFMGMIVIVFAVVICFCLTAFLNYRLKIKKIEIENETVLELQKNIIYFQIETLKIKNELLEIEYKKSL